MEARDHSPRTTESPVHFEHPTARIQRRGPARVVPGPGPFRAVFGLRAAPTWLGLVGLGIASPVWAQDGGGSPISPWMSQVFLFGSFGLIFYFLILRPQQRRQRAMQEMLSSLKSGDKVVTSGGLIGTITDLRDDRVVLKISNEVKAEFTKASITGKADS